jgi:5-methyltetrahydropteroyltriglutamate--homocysteine methyltransferase
LKRSTDRILTTHVGSVAHPPDLHDLLLAQEKGGEVDLAALDHAVKQTVATVVKRQAEEGLTVINDGEVSKVSYTAYIHTRLNGFGREEVPDEGRQGVEARQFPEFYASRGQGGGGSTTVPRCIGPITWKDFSPVEKDIANLKAAAAQVPVEDLFMTAASPGLISISSPNSYYKTEEEYLYAAADAMKREYAAIVDAGITLQLDCPDLAMSRDRTFADLTLAEFRARITQYVEALNYAVDGLPIDRVRMHVCWGRADRPHTSDVDLRDIVDIILAATPMALQITCANARHEHEWKVWKDTKLPDGKILIPGVIDNTTNIVEYPELVADRIVRFARLVGRENVIAGVDCGFSVAPAGWHVDPRVAWAKLHSLALGAELATRELWD